MKLSDARTAYDNFSSKASEISRQLSFAGIALIWIFRAKDASPVAVPSALILPAALFAAGLALNLIHAAYGTAAWGIFHRHHETQEITEANELIAPIWINWPSLVFFWGNVSSVIAAYILTFHYILSLLNGP